MIGQKVPIPPILWTFKLVYNIWNQILFNIAFLTKIFLLFSFQPTSKKHFAIIEKTASFIHSQGAQMEILLKMKQAANPHFGFLSFDNPLYPFYRHVLSAIQSGRYIPGTYEKTSEFSNSTQQLLNGFSRVTNYKQILRRNTSLSKSNPCVNSYFN